MVESNSTGTGSAFTTEHPIAKNRVLRPFHLLFLQYWIPGLIIGVGIFTLVYFILKKRRLDRLRHRLVPFYKFDPGEYEDQWHMELLEEADKTFLH